jgi:hypothetical protein
VKESVDSIFESGSARPVELGREEGSSMSEMNANGGQQDSHLQSADRALAAVDAAKRETLRKLVLGAAFVVPVVATFSVDGLMTAAHATQCGNVAYSGKCVI